MTIDYSRYETLNIARRGPGDSVLDIQMKAANGKLPTAGHAGHRELAEIWRDVGADDSVRCAVLRGEGMGFSGGGDLALVQDMATDFEVRSRVCPSTILALLAAMEMSASSPATKPAPTAGPCRALTMGLSQLMTL